MVFTFTDFGVSGPYLGELEASLYRYQATPPCIHLMSDAPKFNPSASAYLLAALVKRLPSKCVVLGVVDPGVGDNLRAPIVMRADGRWYVGPDNGLFANVAQHAQYVDVWEILWRPQELSNSFHGRDLFAPVAAMLSRGEHPNLRRLGEWVGNDWPVELSEIIYIDRYGNAISGIDARLHCDKSVIVGGERLPRVTTFSRVQRHAGLCYENSSGLLEIAVNQGSACDRYNLSIGSKISLCD